VNKGEYEESPIIALAPSIPFRAEMQSNGVLLQIAKPGLVSLDIYSALGKLEQSFSKHYSSGSHYLSIETLPAGLYIMRIKQESNQFILRLNKQ
jgi:hypothetical protein